MGQHVLLKMGQHVLLKMGQHVLLKNIFFSRFYLKNNLIGNLS
jgi:hypothetical protein